MRWSKSQFESTCLCWRQCCHTNIIVQQNDGTSYQSPTHYKPGVTPSCFYKESIQCRNQLQILRQLRVPPQARISKTPVAVHNPSFPTTSLPLERSTEATVTIPHYGWPNEKEAEVILIDKWARRTEFRSWNISCKSEVSHSWQNSRAAMLRIGEVEETKSIDELITSASVTGDPILDFENVDVIICKRAQENPNRKLQETSHHSRRQSSIGEKITCKQAGCLGDLRLLQHYWRQWGHLDFRDLSKAQLKSDNVQTFDTKWDEVRSAVTDRLTAYWRILY